jgi:sugar lactone lactonase YvrE
MPRRARQCRANPLCVEALEDRLCPSGGYLVVASYTNNSIFRYNENTGAFVDQIDPKNLANRFEAQGMVFGPDHNLYLGDRVFVNGPGNPAVVQQYNGTTGAFQSVFASQNLTSPRGIIFGPDGDLYVADGGTGSSNLVHVDGSPYSSVERFDGQTGAFLNYFVAPASGGINAPGFLVFGPDGNLYVGNVHEGSILRFYGPNAADPGAPDPAPGQSGAYFVPPVGGGLDAPQGLTFGPDGNLYVASSNWFTNGNGPNYIGDCPPGSVLKFEGPSGPHPGAFLGAFVPAGSGGLTNPEAVLFGPNGDLYVSSCVEKLNKFFSNLFSAAVTGTSVVLRYDGTTGAFLGTFVTPDSGGLNCPISMTFTETDPVTLNYDGATPSAPLSVATTRTPTPPPAATPTTSTTRTLRAGLPPGGSIEAAALSVALSLSQHPATSAGDTSPALSFLPAPRPAPSLTSNLPPSGRPSSPPRLSAKAASDRVFTNLDAAWFLTRPGDDLALIDGSSEELTLAKRPG